MTPNVAAITQRARELWAWADGYEDTNEAHARRCRLVARDVLDLVRAYEAEQHARVAMQANYERALAVISSRVYAQAVARAGEFVRPLPLDAETPTAVEGGNPFV